MAPSLLRSITVGTIIIDTVRHRKQSHRKQRADRHHEDTDPHRL
jgi:hypothetical protein